MRIIFQRQAVRDVGTDLSGFRPFRQRLHPGFAERGILSYRLAGADTEHAGTLDQHQIGAGKSDAAREPDHENSRAPGNATQAVFEGLAADGIEHHICAAAIGKTLDSVTERFARVEYDVI